MTELEINHSKQSVRPLACNNLRNVDECCYPSFWRGTEVKWSIQGQKAGSCALILTCCWAYFCYLPLDYAGQRYSHCNFGPVTQKSHISSLAAHLPWCWMHRHATLKRWNLDSPFWAAQFSFTKCSGQEWACWVFAHNFLCWGDDF